MRRTLSRYASVATVRASLAGARDSLERAAQVDFNKLGIRTLKRYKRRYRLKVRHNPTKLELVAAIHSHFGSYKVEEAEVFDFFTYAAKNYKDKNLRDER